MSWVRVLAWAVTGVSVAFAARYGIALGATAVEAVALGATFAILDLFKCHLPQLTMVARARGRWFVAIAGGVGFGGLSLLNVWGTMSVEILERAALAANQTRDAQQLTDLEAQRRRVENRLRVLGETRPVASVEADMAAERRDRRWTASKGCTDVKRDSRAYCAAYDRLFGELAAAPEGVEKRARLEELDRQISETRAAQTPNASELQLVARLAGIDAETAGLIRALVLAVVLEFVCAFALTLEWASRPYTASPEGGPSPATHEAGSPLEVKRGETFAPINDGTSGREEAAVPSSRNAVSPVTPSESLGVVRAPTIHSGPGGGVLRVVQGGAAVASKIAAETHTRRLPTELHAATARRVPAASSRTRPSNIPGARTHACATSQFEGGRGEDGCASRPQPPPPNIGTCVCASHMADFVREYLVLTEGASVSFAELRAAYHTWCAATGRDPVSNHRLGAALKKFGFVKWKSCGRIRYRNLQLRA